MVLLFKTMSATSHLSNCALGDPNERGAHEKQTKTHIHRFYEILTRLILKWSGPEGDVVNGILDRRPDHSNQDSKTQI